ncbi:UDP-N-acetylmuramoylalanine--D-glutamate ligase [Desulfuromusa kysingii]|uniref:UDP-N-acetylmuramoylalanine--D-glutamate ligase n=1 Tax=Desulfuromusa kysingii TaxID=37625 RepID=A0A1H3ZGS4_9BACT|nr:UDP-N-acetylmuramoyl-L-alanine--D-glutamate ligase [Desulfuromusa kysingii]SEA22857.1 UDP-N-acetylmuramoylalanine--D-glutamate ligase [Desulfuromusa kysingii]
MKINYSGKKIVVIGAGRSGIALASYFYERGATVAISDLRERKQLAGLDSLSTLPIRFDLGGHDLELFAQADLIAVSPGVSLTCEPLRRASSCAIPLLGEIEIASREIRVPIIGVTGTNGKSTTTSLIGEIMAAWGKKVFVGGNLGTPLVEACAVAIDGVVVELSSFQLETIDQFHPSIALLLNLSSDHLDRYPDLQSYYRAKLQVFRNMTAADFVVLNADDAEVCRLTADLPATKVWFSAKGRMVDGMVRLGDRLVWNWSGADIQLPLSSLQLSGEHNIENAMAAMIPALLQGCPAELAWNAVCSFGGLKHRMQRVRQLDGVDWYNDSKGTNVGSVMKSLAGFSSAVTLIAGGKDKGGDYTLLRPQLEQKVSCLILIGEAAQKMAAALSGCCEIRIVSDLQAAVQQAFVITKPGGTVLLSPACSSFDMFASFQARGDEFERLVQQLSPARETL